MGQGYEDEAAMADLTASGGFPEAQALSESEAVVNARRYVALPAVDSDTRRVLSALLAETDDERQELRGQVATALAHLREEAERRERAEKAYDNLLTSWDDCRQRLREAERERDGAKRHAAYLEEQRAIAETKAERADQWRGEADDWREKYLNELVSPDGERIHSEHAEMQWGLENVHTLARRAMNAPTEDKCREKLPHIIRICEQQSPKPLGGSVLRKRSQNVSEIDTLRSQNRRHVHAECPFCICTADADIFRQVCTREQPHDGPCNGLPCAHAVSQMNRGAMPPCASCGHRWGDHARPPHVDADVDDGKRWCFALTDDGECRCRNYVNE